MELVWTTLSVSDMDASLAFYTDLLGLPVRRRFTTGDGAQIAFLGDAAGPAVELIRRGPPPERPRGAGVSVGFRTGSLDQAMMDLSNAGIPILRGPISAGDGVRFFFVLDPDGYEIQIVEQPGHV